jgi:separase
MDSITDALPRTGADKATFTESKPLNPPLLGGDKGLDAAQWRIAQGTLETLLALARTYFARGSNRESEYFALQAQELAEAISAHLMIARALLHRAELQVSLGKLAEARKFLDKADIHLKGAMVIDYADALRLRGVCKVLDEDRDSAREYYENASSALGKLERTLEKVEGTR